jgi:hypothetical protein
MPLAASGAISLGGSTACRSIALELSRSATATININCSEVRTLGGVPTAGAQISLSNFYGKSALSTVGKYFGGCNTPTNRTTRINQCGASVGSETLIGTARQETMGAAIGALGVFYAGVASGGSVGNIVTRVNNCGTLVGSETNVGSIRYDGAGVSAGPNAMFYSGFGFTANSRKVTRINACGALVGSETCIAFGRYGTFGASAGSVGLFWGGIQVCSGLISVNQLRRVNFCGAQVGVVTNVGTERSYGNGTKVGSNGMFFGGSQITSFFCSCDCVMSCIIVENYNPYVCTLTRINACGSLVGEAIFPGGGCGATAKCHYRGGSATIGNINNGVWYGGTKVAAAGILVNRVLRINQCGAIVGSETNVGTARWRFSGSAT